MPFYEYHCKACGRRVTLFWTTMAKAREASPRCPLCGSGDLERRYSRFAIGRGGGRESSADSFDELERMASSIDENDPADVARFIRRMSDEFGEPLEPEYEEAVEMLESGSSVDEVDDMLAEKHIRKHEEYGSPFDEREDFSPPGGGSGGGKEEGGDE